MDTFDANITLTPYRATRGFGAIVFDHERIRQASPELFDPQSWGECAQPVHSGGRGGAWFIKAPFGDCILRHYRRGGVAAKFSQDRYLWSSAHRTRSFAEFFLTRQLLKRGLPVPSPFAAAYLREGWTYRAAILLERLPRVRSFGEWVQEMPQEAPWKETGQLIARFHREGLDHVDLNVQNVLYDAAGKGWLIDFDRCAIRIPATHWRESNLRRLRRSLSKLATADNGAAIERGYESLREAYMTIWKRGY